MGRKSIVKQTVATVLLIIVFYAFFNTSIYPYTYNNVHFHTHENSIGKIPQKSVKVYMYDLPRKFTYGVIKNYLIVRGQLENEDEASLKYPGNQHAAEWYLFSDLNNPKRSGAYVTRVLDPDSADLFYVPFFSSLSLVANPVRDGPVVVEHYNDVEMQEDLMEWLGKQPYWKRNHGRDHVFICQDPNALHNIVNRVKDAMLLVSDFGRLGHNQASFVKDVILPYSHRITTYKGDIGVENRKYLMFFMGNRYRKEGGKIRDFLFKILENEEDVVIKHGTQSRESRRMATQGMHSSKFCLHPAGDTPSAYTDSAVTPGYLVKLLRGVKTGTILEFQQELTKVRHYFEYDDPKGSVNEIWRQVSLKVPLIKLMINRDKRLVKRELTEPDCSCLCTNQTGIHESFHDAAS
ncbi:probable arabinosyltransferase ARAD1 isoform X2 [Lactuca sativa]|uniref:probable arabinosyltransferase ARAD1 isoform X2 n=1 Tax=Lactuca sativa TaxID=4236 RepID=UPI000CD8ED9A|nr:probable arabinosyltransferase ARAD1 isoform X2 [Lactuca sativa]